MLRKLSLKSLREPVVMVAPMNGGINNPAFAASVINNGGIAGFGFTYHSPKAISNDISNTRSLCHGPINANFFVFDEFITPTPTSISSAVEALTNRLKVDKSLIKVPTEPYTPNLSAQIEAVWKEKPEVLTFHFGIPKKEYLKEAHRLCITTGVTATSVQEAQLIQESGADFVIAQGIEAGGHRGIFNSTWALMSTAAENDGKTRCFVLLMKTHRFE